MRRTDTVQLSSQIRAEALRLGFAKIGIAPAGSLPNEERFTAWLAKGFHGEMRYMERQAAKRLDPRMVLADARSILVLALNYYPGEVVVAGSMEGRISRYAWGDDYHSIFENRLGILLDFVTSLEPAAHGIWYADTGPVMEKAWGALTSLGWLGKHTGLITRNYGSWIFLGVILLDIELECDSSVGDFCGKCHRCIDACPTGAITFPYVLDARRCISYLTIELRGPIPRPLRPLIGNRIFGCDDCQEACPWNRFAVKSSQLEFHAREGNPAPDLVPLLRISPDEFRKRFKGSPIWRATRDGFLRNVAVALGNSGRPEAVPALGETLQDASRLVRAHAAWALGRIEDDDAFRLLESARERENDPTVLEEISLALRTLRLTIQ